MNKEMREDAILLLGMLVIQKMLLLLVFAVLNHFGFIQIKKLEFVSVQCPFKSENCQYPIALRVG